VTTVTLSGYFSSYSLSSLYSTLIVNSNGTVGSGGVSTGVENNYYVSNYGRIGVATETSNGVQIFRGGTVVNNLGSAILASGNGVNIGTGYEGRGTHTSFGSVVNDGSIMGATGAGVALGYNLLQGAFVTNGSNSDTAARIEGATGIDDTAGVFAKVDATIDNFGIIQGDDHAAGYAGIVLAVGTPGTIVNGSAQDSLALISGYVGVDGSASGRMVVQNFGTIEGSSGTAVSFAAAHPGTLIVEGGAKFIGTVDGAGGSALQLAGDAGAGTLSGLGTSFINFANISVNSGASWTLTGANTIASGVSLTNNGTLIDNGILTNDGAMTLASQLLVSETLENSGSIVVAAYDALAVSPGGYLLNELGGTIDFAGVGKYFNPVVFGAGGGGTSTVVNLGTISNAAGDTGVYFSGAGNFTNGSASDSTALIQAPVAVYSYHQPIAVTNFGTIQGTGGGSLGIQIAGGSVINGAEGHTTALIESEDYGVLAVDRASTIANFGTIQSSYVGIDLRSGGSVVNGSSNDKTALIQGPTAIKVDTSGTINNYGTISSSNGTAISFASAADLLQVEAGAVFVGAVAGGGGTLELMAGAPGGTLSGVGTQFTGFSNILNDVGASWVLAGSNTLGTGVTLTDSGTLINEGSILTDGLALQVAGGGSLVNAGSISGSASIGAGVYLAAGSSITNQSGGAISGYRAIVATGAATVVNSGAIDGDGTSAFGVDLRAGGSVTNQSGGTISGGLDAVRFAAGYSSLLVVDPGAVFIGTVTGGNTIGSAVVSTLELASGASAGTLTGLGSQFIDFSNITIDSAATWTVSGTIGAGYAITDSGMLTNTGDLGSGVTLGAGATLINAAGAYVGFGGEGSGPSVAGLGGGASTIQNLGTIGSFADTEAGDIGISLSGGGTVVDSGTILGATYALIFGGTGSNLLVLEQGYALFGAVVGSAGASNTVELQGSVSAPIRATYDSVGFVNFHTIAFAAGTNNDATWVISNGAPFSNGTPFTGVIAGFAPSDTIDLAGIGLATGATIEAGNTLVVTTSGGGSIDLQLDPSADFSGEFVHVAQDGAGTGTDLTIATVAPVQIGGAAANQALIDETTIQPFASVSLTDPNPGQTETLTITLSNAANGSLSGAGLVDEGGGAFALTGTIGAVTSELDALVFTPTAHQVAPGNTVDTSFTLSLQDTIGQTASNTATSVVATAVSDMPVIGGSLAGQLTSDAAVLSPFSGVTVTDPDLGASETIAITLTSNGVATDADGVLSGAGLTRTGVGTYMLAAGTPADVTQALQALVFTPTAHQVAPGQTVTTGFTIADADNHGTSTSNTTTSVIATAVEHPPVLGGTVAAQSATFGVGEQPFADVTITDPDLGASETVTITLETASGTATDANGTLAGAGLTNTGTGTYQLAAGSPAAVTAALDALTFTPTANQAPAGQTVTTDFVLSVSDGIAPPVTDSTTTVIAGNTDPASVTSVTATPATAVLGPNGTATLTLTFSQAVTVAGGTPTLTLNDGGTATYDAAASTATTLMFDYTVGAGQNTPDLTVSSLALNGATIRDANGNDAVLTGAVANPAGTLQVDTTPPTVSSPTLPVAENAAATPIGLTAPTDPNFAPAQLTITVDTLPTDGAVTLADGATPVTTGETLTAAQLAGLEFTPTAGLFDTTSSFTYTVADPANNASTGTATLSIDAAVGDPIATPGTLSVAFGQGATAVGIQAPTDPNFPAADLTVTVDALPTDGTLTLADGVTPITVNEVLSVAQLTSLMFIAGPGVSNAASSFSYTVSDPAENSSTGSFALDVGAQPVPSAPTITTPNEITDTATPTIVGTAAPGSQVSLFDGNTLVATTAADGLGNFTAILSGGLVLGSNSLTATATNVVGPSAASAAVGIFDVGAPGTNGVVSTDFDSLQLGTLLGQGYALAFISGTEAVTLVDGTLSVGPDTQEATIQRLYEGLLGHTGTPSGLSFWDASLSATSASSVAAGFLNSPEYLASAGTMTNTQFVDSLYEGFLGRAPDPSGGAFWTGLLDSGTSRADVVIGIDQSQEAKTSLASTTSQVWVPNAAGTLAEELYQTGLDRTVDPNGLSGVTSALQQGATPLQIVQGIVASPEFQALHGAQSNAAFVTSLYEDALGRMPDASGDSFYLGLLNSGAGSRADVLLDIATSPEAAMHLTANLA
jgi:plastocyanin